MDADDAIEALKTHLERQGFSPLSEPTRSTEAQLVEAESALGHRLPEDFRWFSLTNGEGMFKNPSGRSINLADGTTVALDRIGGTDFLPDKYGGTYWPPDFPPGLVRCADTIMGEVYFLRLDPPHNGSVWFWNYYEGKDAFEGLVKAADSFTDLVASAGPPPAESP